MKIEILQTADGSNTLYLPELDETYHSRHGSRQEALHVFIQHGLQYFREVQPEALDIQLLEVGFGTGLNAFLTFQEMSEQPKLHLNYIGYETHPVAQEIWEQLNYAASPSENQVYQKIMEAPYGKKTSIAPNFDLEKIQAPIQSIDLKNQLDLVYFDAFGPRAQTEMWEISIFEKLYNALKPGGILVTYCAMGQFKRDLKSLGFSVQAIPGPPGKREMTRAIKI
ncbi:MAG: tRNA (5-methylaminomethyl-2-thiouridine)(34)-methyltransferase MnmD [Bacteroidota bacterium]|jgi:tRNA U34 5-methylaminomethyl-2-thiouridine-forming methyltransferase MnmC